MSDDLERRLRAAFRSVGTPGASPALRDAIRRLPLDDGGPGRRSAGRPMAVRLAGGVLAAAIVLAAVIVLPSIGGGRFGVGSSGAPGSAAASPPGSAGSTASPSGPASPAPSSAPAVGSGLPSVPGDFAPSSVSFASAELGWAAGRGSCDAGTCLWVLRTTDGGRTWTAAAAPRPDPGASIGLPTSIRFADAVDGWLYGAGLWATHDGGATWSAVTIPGVAPTTRIRDLQAAGGTVYAAVLEDGGAVRVASAPVDRDAWTLAAPSIQPGAGPVPSPELLLAPAAPDGAAAAGATGWLIEVDRSVVGGLRLEGGEWRTWTPPCLDAAGPAILVGTSPTDVDALCDVGVWSTPKGIELRSSTDAGTTFWPRPGTVPLGSLQDAAAAASTIVAAGNGRNGSDGSALAASFDGGRTWTRVGPSTIDGIVTDLAFADPLDAAAVAVTGDSRGRLLTSADGGRTWVVGSFTAPPG